MRHVKETTKKSLFLKFTGKEFHLTTRNPENSHVNKARKKIPRNKPLKSIKRRKTKMRNERGGEDKRRGVEERKTG